MSILTVIRDAKKEIKQSIKDKENAECIIKLNPWKYDYSKLEELKSQQIKSKVDDEKNKQENDVNDDEFDDDLLFIGMEEEELTELESLRVYQIYECVMFVDEVINHIYLFIIKHFRENINDLDGQKKWLNSMVSAIKLLPNYVDELSCCIYSLPSDTIICKNASNLLHFLWKIAIDIAEESIQYKARKMVIKNKKKKSKLAVTGYEWKCKFVDYNLKIGQMFGLVSMDHINKFIENDSNYNKKKEHKKKHKIKHNNNKKHKKRDKNRKYKKKKSKHSGNDMSASSNKEAEESTMSATNTTASNTQTEEINDNDDDQQTQRQQQESNNEDMIDID